jgi:hypothetical protein
VKRNDLPGNGKAKTKMLFVFPRGIYAVKTPEYFFSGLFRNTGPVIGNSKQDYMTGGWAALQKMTRTAA